MKNKKKINKRRYLFLALVFFFTNLLTFKTLKKVEIHDIKIQGSKLFSKKDIFDNSSLNTQTSLIFIKTNYLERELKQNLSLENVSVTKVIFPFSLKVFIKPRTPVAYGEKLFNGEKISGFIDKHGFFIYKQHAEVKNLEKLTLKVFGWQENFRKALSKILFAQKKENVELINISFSPSGFVTLEEKDLKTILLGFNPNLITSQFQIIKKFKGQLKGNKFFKKIDNIDLTDPKTPKIKVFKP